MRKMNRVGRKKVLKKSEEGRKQRSKQRRREDRKEEREGGREGGNKDMRSKRIKKYEKR